MSLTFLKNKVQFNDNKVNIQWQSLLLSLTEQMFHTNLLRGVLEFPQLIILMTTQLNKVKQLSDAIL